MCNVYRASEINSFLSPRVSGICNWYAKSQWIRIKIFDNKKNFSNPDALSIFSRKPLPGIQSCQLALCNLTFCSLQDKHWFEDVLSNVCREHLGEEATIALTKEQYFVDFLRDAEEPTGDEPVDDLDLEVPHVYEPIPSWEILRDRLTYFMGHYNEQVKERGLLQEVLVFNS